MTPFDILQLLKLAQLRAVPPVQDQESEFDSNAMAAGGDALDVWDRAEAANKAVQKGKKMYQGAKGLVRGAAPLARATPGGVSTGQRVLQGVQQLAPRASAAVGRVAAPLLAQAAPVWSAGSKAFAPVTAGITAYNMFNEIDPRNEDPRQNLAVGAAHALFNDTKNPYLGRLTEQSAAAGRGKTGVDKWWAQTDPYMDKPLGAIAQVGSIAADPATYQGAALMTGLTKEDPNLAKPIQGQAAPGTQEAVSQQYQQQVAQQPRYKQDWSQTARQPGLSEDEQAYILMNQHDPKRMAEFAKVNPKIQPSMVEYTPQGQRQEYAPGSQQATQAQQQMSSQEAENQKMWGQMRENATPWGQKGVQEQAPARAPATVAAAPSSVAQAPQMRKQSSLYRAMLKLAQGAPQAPSAQASPANLPAPMRGAGQLPLGQQQGWMAELRKMLAQGRKPRSAGGMQTMEYRRGEDDPAGSFARKQWEADMGMPQSQDPGMFQPSSQNPSMDPGMSLGPFMTRQSMQPASPLEKSQMSFGNTDVPMNERPPARMLTPSVFQQQNSMPFRPSLLVNPPTEGDVGPYSLTPQGRPSGPMWR